MRKVKVGTEEMEFLEEKEINSLYEDLLQSAGRRHVAEKVINKAKKTILKQTKKMEKDINRGKVKSEQLRKLRESTKRLEDIIKDPSSYTGSVIEEILKSL